MGISPVEATAIKNMIALGKNPYPGKGIVIGVSEDGLFAVQVYWLMGQKEKDQNYVLKNNHSRVFTEVFDPSKMKRSDTVIYNTMMESKNLFVVSNGNQTDTVIKAFAAHPFSMTLREALITRRYEPDEPNFTPRITGICCFHQGKCHVSLALLRRSDLVMDDDHCARSDFDYHNIRPGFGFCITTYDGDSKEGGPLPSFSGVPYSLPIVGDIDEATGSYWNLLNSKNKVSLAVKFIEIATGKSFVKIINKLTK